MDGTKTSKQEEVTKEIEFRVMGNRVEVKTEVGSTGVMGNTIR